MCNSSTATASTFRVLGERRDGTRKRSLRVQAGSDVGRCVLHIDGVPACTKQVGAPQCPNTI